MIANLAIELDNLDDEITIILNRQHYGINWILAGVIDDTAARKIMEESKEAVHRRIVIITKDYGKLLSRKDIVQIKERIDSNKERLKLELAYENLQPISEQYYVDELGQAHTITEEDFRASYEKEVADFLKSIDMQKMRLGNYYKRISSERAQKRLEVWIPIIISVLSLLLSIISLTQSNYAQHS